MEVKHHFVTEAFCFIIEKTYFQKKMKIVYDDRILDNFQLCRNLLANETD